MRKFHDGNCVPQINALSLQLLFMGAHELPKNQNTQMNPTSCTVVFDR